MKNRVSVLPLDQSMDNERKTMTESKEPDGVISSPSHQSMENTALGHESKFSEVYDLDFTHSSLGSMRDKIWSNSYHNSYLNFPWCAEKLCASFACFMAPTIYASSCCDQYVMKPLAPHNPCCYSATSYICGCFYGLGCCLPNAAVAAPLSCCVAGPSYCCIGCVAKLGSIKLKAPSRITEREADILIQKNNLTELLRLAQSPKFRYRLTPVQKLQIMLLSVTHIDNAISLKTRVQLFLFMRDCYIKAVGCGAGMDLSRLYSDSICLLLTTKASHTTEMLRWILEAGKYEIYLSDDMKSKITECIINSYEEKRFTRQEIEAQIKLFQPYRELDDPRILTIIAAPTVLIGLFKPKESKNALVDFAKDELFDRNLVRSIFQYAGFTNTMPREMEEENKPEFMHDSIVRLAL